MRGYAQRDVHDDLHTAEVERSLGAILRARLNVTSQAAGQYSMTDWGDICLLSGLHGSSNPPPIGLGVTWPAAPADRLFRMVRHRMRVAYYGGGLMCMRPPLLYETARYADEMLDEQ